MIRADAEASAERLNRDAPDGVTYEVRHTAPDEQLTIGAPEPEFGGWYVRRVHPRYRRDTRHDDEAPAE